jgi:hypothetical protein
MIQSISLNSVEFSVFIAILLIQVFRLIIRKVPSIEVLLILICCVPAAFFISKGCIRFLSWDESYVFYDIINFRTGPIAQWSNGAFRTSITLWGPLFSAIQYFTHITKDVVLVLVKVAHMLTGVLLLTIIIDQMQCYFFPKQRHSILHAIMFNAVMFLPVTNLTLKTLNYDMLSMLLGVLGTVMCISGIGNKNTLRIFSGIIILTLATHEKLIASPLLWIGMIASVSALSWPNGKCTIATFTSRIITYSLAIPALSLLTIVISFIFVHITRESSIPGFTAQQMLLAYSSVFWPLWNLFHIGSSFFNNTVNTSLILEMIKVLKGFLIITCIIFTGSITLITLLRIITARRLYTAIPRINIVVTNIIFLIFSAITITGIIAGYTLHTKIWPVIPIPEGNFIPSATFNDIAFQFGAKTALGHTLFSAAWACAVFTNSLPTAILFLALLGGILNIRSHERYSVNASVLLLNLFTLLCICTPVAYGVVQLPLYSRYFNLFLLGSIICLVPVYIKWQGTRPKLFFLISITAFLFTVIELYPFQPFPASFHPAWSNCSSTINKQPSPGNVTPWYPGWGEELPDALECITEIFVNNTQEIRLYHNFPSALIRPPQNVVTSAMPKGHGKLPYLYSDHDFYILSRNGVSTYSYIPFPYNVDPLFTIGNRGFIKAWVFRGSDLYNNGFCF